MIFEPSQFYNQYLKDYHKTKAIYLKKMLDNIEKAKELFIIENNYDSDDIKSNFRKIIQCELRQNYFHAIETFFELFFALDPRGKEYLDDKNIQFNLTNSQWRKTFKKIQNIHEKSDSLEFLNELMIYGNKKITIGHFLFYTGIPLEKYPDMKESLEAIKKGIRILASDFLSRDEYNAYKHGLRLISSVQELRMFDPKTKETNMKWDLSDSMSYYQPTKDPNEITIITKVFDSERDFQMAYFCSNLIHQLIYYRRIAMGITKKGEDKIPITFFGNKLVEDCFKINVPIQDIVYSVSKNKNG